MQSMFVNALTVVSFIAVAFTGTFTYAAEKIIKIDGSSTVYPISEAVAEEFQSAQKIKVTVGESGTGGGFKNSVVVKLIFLTLHAQSHKKRWMLVKKLVFNLLNCQLLMTL